MTKSALVTAAVLAVSAAAVVVWVATRSGAGEPKRPPARGPSPHGAAMDDSLASVLAMYDAPEGASPCETAHNAFAAEAKKARSLGRESHFAFVADRTAFLAGCQALASDVQLCLAPRYMARNRELCQSALPPKEALSHLYRERASEEDVLAEDDPLLPPQ